jgi:predicted dehydrogenase
MTVRIGFLGTGFIATYHSKSLRVSKADVVRAGAFDPDTERLEAFCRASGHVPCSSEEEVLQTCDAVYICTWTSEHPRLVDLAVRYGVAVFVEKPLATSLTAARQVGEALTTSGTVNQVGLVLRYSPAYVWARHLVQAPEAGRLMAVVFRDDQFIPIQGHYASTWRADVQKVGAGTLIEHSIHDVDALEWLCGPVADASARSSFFHGIDGIEDVLSASFRFENGATGSLTSVWHDNLSRPSLRRVELFCERRYVHIGGSDEIGPVEWQDRDGSAGSITGDELRSAVAPLLEHGPNPDAAFVEAVRSGTPAYPDVTAAVRAHEVVDALYASAAAEHLGAGSGTMIGR